MNQNSQADKKDNGLSLDTLDWLIIGIGGVSCIAIILIWIFPSALPDKIAGNIFQLFAVAGVGGVITYFYKQIDQERDQRKALLLKQSQIYAELREAYSNVKAARRALRAHRLHIENEEYITKSDYEKQVEVLGENQLIIETYQELAERKQFPLNNSPYLAMQLDDAEKYLGYIISEYEDELLKFTGDPPRRKLSDLKQLSTFIAPVAVNSDFKLKFATHIHSVLAELAIPSWYSSKGEIAGKTKRVK